MSRSFVSIQLLTLSLTLSACSGNGSRVLGQQCPRRFDPVPMNVEASRKAELKPSNLPDGTYELVRSQLFFKGDPTPTAPDGFQVSIKEEVPKRARTSDLATVTECFRNSKVTQEYGVRVDGISGLVITNGHATSTVKTFGFTMSEDNAFEVHNTPSAQKPTHPMDVFAKADETFVLNLGARDFEIRSRGRGLNGTYYLSTFLHKTK